MVSGQPTCLQRNHPHPGLPLEGEGEGQSPLCPAATAFIMSLKINELCVNCDVCEPACPNQAISQGETIYVIDPARCTECVGHFDEPQCVVVCPVECIDPDLDHPEDRETLLAKLRRLQQAEGQPPVDAPAAQAGAADVHHPRTAWPDGPEPA